MARRTPLFEREYTLENRKPGKPQFQFPVSTEVEALAQKAKTDGRLSCMFVDTAIGCSVSEDPRVLPRPRPARVCIISLNDPKAQKDEVPSRTYIPGPVMEALLKFPLSGKLLRASVSPENGTLTVHPPLPSPAALAA